METQEMNKEYWVEKVYTERGRVLKFIAFKICKDMQIAEDCVQEAAIVALKAPMEKENFGTTFCFMRTIIKRMAVNHIKRRAMHHRNADMIGYLTHTEARDNQDTLPWYPLNKVVFGAIDELSREYKIALLSYAYSIPFTELFPDGTKGHASLHQKLQTAIRMIRRRVRGEVMDGNLYRAKKTGSTSAPTEEERITDRAVGLYKMGMKIEDIARVFNTKERNISNRIFRRLKTSEKYPSLYKPTDLADKWYEENFKNFYQPNKKPGHAKIEVTEEQIKQVRKLLEENLPIREIRGQTSVPEYRIREINQCEYKLVHRKRVRIDKP